MKPKKTRKINIKQLNESLEFAKAIEKKLQEFNDNSEKVAEKWQKKVEYMSKKSNK